MTKQEIAKTVAECSEKLGHVPSMTELTEMTGVGRQEVRKLFGSYSRLLAECKLRGGGPGHKLSSEELFQDWATVVRTLKKLPSLAEYELVSKYSQGPLTRRFTSWRQVPRAMVQLAEKEGWAEEWKDVMDIVAEQDTHGRGRTRISGPKIGPMIGRRTPLNGTIYGPLLHMRQLAHGPTNEQGVIFLFGAMAEELGFVMTFIQTAYPDGEAMRQIDEDTWERLRIEFEYESRNFLKHMHEVSECDLIVCWKHNWADCPLEVVELSKAVKDKQAAMLQPARSPSVRWEA